MELRSVRSAILLALILATSTALAAPLRNFPVTLRQPDGATLQLFVSGDEYLNWIHDANGYTIIQDPNTGYYTFAVPSGNTVAASQYVVGRVDPESVGLKPRTLPSPEIAKQMRAHLAGQTAGPGDVRPHAAPHSGTLNNIVIYVRFSDETEFTETLSSYDSMFNSTAAGANSLRNYYSEVSYGQLTVATSMLWPVASPPAGAVVSYQDSHPRAYYQPYSATNTIGYSSTGYDRRDREHALLTSALNAVAPYFPAGLNIDGDNDGLVDNITFIVKGGPDGWSSLLWPHEWSIYETTVNLAGKRVYTYNLQLETSLGTNNVGVLAHEMFHSLGAPDLYHYSQDDFTPVGSWDLMEWNTNPPQHMSAYMKFKYGHWISSLPVISTPGTYTLNPLTSSTGNIYRINSPNSTTQYFVAEFRKQTGTFESSLPGEGLVIYRIDTSAVGNASGPPDEVYAYRPNGFPGSDGLVSSANYNSTVGRTSIDDSTLPWSFLQDGSQGGLKISGIGAVGSTMSFTLGSPIATCSTQTPALSVPSSAASASSIRPSITGLPSDGTWKRTARTNGEIWTYTFDVGGGRAAGSSGAKTVLGRATLQTVPETPTAIRASDSGTTTLDIAATRAFLMSSDGVTEVTSPTPGQQVVLAIGFNVTGASGTFALPITVSLDGSTYGSWNVTGVSNGSWWWGPYWVATSGQHTFQVTLDYNNSLAETNEANNTASDTFNVAGVTDVAATRAYLRTGAAGAGTEVDPPAVGQNVYFHLNWGVTGGTLPVGVTQQAQLDSSTFCGCAAPGTPGSTYTSSCRGAWTATAGSHTLTWNLDYANNVAETDETNNSATKTFTPGGGSITVSSVMLSPASVPASGISTGTVTLSAAAPTGGTVVTLSSSDVNAASVPSSVTVPAGSTGTTFTVTTYTSVTHGGSVTITATVGSSSVNSTLTIVTKPSITKTFGASTILLNGSTSLTFSITNPNTSIALTGVAFADSLPSGLVVSTPNGLSGSCGGGSITATAGSASVSLSNATLSGGTSCTFSVNVAGTSLGTKNNSVQVSSTNGGTGNTSNAGLTVIASTNSACRAAIIGGLSVHDKTGSTQLTDPLPLPGGHAVDGIGNTWQVNPTAGLMINAQGTSERVADLLIYDAQNGNPACFGAGSTIVITFNGPISSPAAPGNLTTSNMDVYDSNGVAGLSIASATVGLAFAANTVQTIITITVGQSGSSSSTPFFPSDPAAGGATGAALRIKNLRFNATALSNGATTISVVGSQGGRQMDVVNSVTQTPQTVVATTLPGLAQPTIAKSFGASTLPLNGSTSLTFSVTNPNSSVLMNGLGFTDTLPSGLVVATPNGLTGSCGGGTILAPPGSASVTLAGATLGPSTCTFSVNVVATAVGAKTNTVQLYSFTNGWANTSTASLTVPLEPPTFGMMFGAFDTPSIALNATESLMFSITNPNSTGSILGLSFTDNLPAGLIVATPSNLSSTCNGTATADAGSGTISLSGGTIAPQTYCTIQVTVQGTTAGQKVNTTSALTSNNAPTVSGVTKTIYVAPPPPTIAKSFGASTIPFNGTTSLSFTITNNLSYGEDNIAFTDNFPAGLVVATPNGLTVNSCGSVANVTAVAGSSSVSLAFGSGFTTCTISVNVKGTTPGLKNNSVTVSSRQGGTGNTATASLTVLVAAPTLTIAFWPNPIALGQSTRLTFSVSNPNASSSLSSVALVDTLPAGLVVATPNGLGSTCTGTTTATPGAGTVSWSGGTLAASGFCQFWVDVTATTAGTKVNTTGAITSTESGAGATANASLSVISSLSPVSVSPMNGGGALATFAFLFNDPNGYADITLTQQMFGLAAGSYVHDCATAYDNKSNQLYLQNDTGSGWLGPVAIGSGATLANSQCTIDAAASSIVASGTILTVKLATTFSGSYATPGAHAYAYVQNAGGQNSGWMDMGAWNTSALLDASMVSPSAGTGSSRAFTFVYTDPKGYTDIGTSYAQIGGPMVSYVNNCITAYDQTSNQLYLMPDNGANWMGPVSLGSAGQLSNSQCTIDSGASSVIGTDTVLRVTLAVTFGSGFTGAQNIYSSVTSKTGGSSGTRLVGTWNPVAVLSAAQVSPNGGTGSTRTFSFLFTDPAGHSHLSTAIMTFGPAAGSYLNNCSVAYDHGNDQVYLMSDSGAGWLGPLTLGGAGTLQNSQCTIDAGASSSVSAGNNLTVNLAVTFASGFAGTKGVFALAQTVSAVDSGWQQLGTWNTSTILSAAQVAPNSGTGSTRTFTFLFSDPAGFADIVTAQTIFGTAPGSYVNNCSIAYSRASNQLFLQNDTGSGWLGPVSVGGAGIVQNSQCLVDGGASSFNGSGNNLSLALAISFKAAFTGTKGIWGWVQSGATQNSGWQSLGTWNTTTILTAAQVSPSSATGSTRTFSFLYTDPNGFADITSALAMFGTAAGSYVNNCSTAYDRASNQLFLMSDSGAGWLGPMTVGVTGTLENSQCSIDLAASSASGAGSNLTVNLGVTFKAAFAGTKSIFGWVQNAAAQNSGWRALGTWNTATILGAAQVSPNSGSGSPRTFSFLFTDPNGYTDITTTQTMFGFLPTSYLGVCATAYGRASNVLYLQNDAGTGWLGPLTLGTATTLSNSQCSISGAGSSASGSGLALTLNLAVTFGSGLNPSAWQSTPTVGIFGWVQGATAGTSAWQQLGSYSH